MSSRDRANAGMRASNIANSLGVNDPRIRRGMQLPEALKLGQGLRIDDKGRIALDFSALSVEGTREILNQINSVVRIDRAITIDKTVENPFDDSDLLAADEALGEDIGSLYSTKGSMQGDISYALGELLTLASSLASQGTSIYDLAGRVSTLEGYHVDPGRVEEFIRTTHDFDNVRIAHADTGQGTSGIPRSVEIASASVPQSLRLTSLCFQMDLTALSEDYSGSSEDGELWLKALLYDDSDNEIFWGGGNVVTGGESRIIPRGYNPVTSSTATHDGALGDLCQIASVYDGTKADRCNPPATGRLELYTQSNIGRVSFVAYTKHNSTNMDGSESFYITGSLISDLGVLPV